MFFLVTSTAVAFLMHKSGEVVARREGRWRAEIAARNTELECTAAQLAESVRVRDAMLAGVTHDLRSPLTVIKAQVQLARRRVGRLEATTTQALDPGLRHIEDAARRMARWIDELLDVAQIHQGAELALDRAPTDLVALVRRAVAEYQQNAARHEVVLEAPDASILGDWDTGRLERILDNLLGNAIKCSPSGGRVEVRVWSEDEAAAVSVRDYGVGVPSSEVQRVFEPFQRGSNVVGRIRGLGIGLAGASQIVRQHGGRIELDSAEGAGSTFTVRLPRLVDESADCRVALG